MLSKIKRFLSLRHFIWSIKKPRIDNVVFEYDGSSINSEFEGYNKIGSGTRLVNCFIGRGTYIAGNTTFNNVKIGRFCSIGQNVKNKHAFHPSKDWISTHPSFFSTNKQAGFTFVDKNKVEEHRYIDAEKKLHCVIGNDVWIGNDVRILEGIKIGDGAIIALGAVVTKDVEPYSIVAGIPAKHVRFRFEQTEIDFLLRYKWWEKEMDWLRDNAPLFCNVKHLIRKENQ